VNRDTAKSFWEHKIIGWENDRYAGNKRWGKSLRFRKEFALECLRPYVSGKNIVELGCGSGDLGPRLIAEGAHSYHGVDFAENAIKLARRRVPSSLRERITYEATGVKSLPPLSGDIVFSLGLLDWLDSEEIARVFQLSAGKTFLHSFSERKPAASQLIHRLYVFLAYGYRTGGYVPQYHTVDELRRRAVDPLAVKRHPRLSFGAFVCREKD